ncbi:MAG: hypothetical protein CMH66_11510, partial [Nioella sp.]|nr:hypothetical protein [Nioella sp.]
EYQFEQARGMGIDRPTLNAILASPRPAPNLQSQVAWKEPNTHVFLPQLARRFSNMKYIHVMRNGLDMALSGNRQQLRNWGSHFNIRQGDDESPEQVQLRYWLATNRRAIELGESLLPKRFFLLNYDALCLSFHAEIYRLQNFLERQLSGEEISMIAGSIAPESIGRYRESAADTFTSEERKAVQKLGFCVD